MSAVEFSEEELTARGLAVLLPELPVERVFRADEQGLAIARRFGISYAVMMGPQRGGVFPRARRELYVLLKRLGWSYPQIARFAKRDHTTIMAAIGETPEERRLALWGRVPGEAADP